MRLETKIVYFILATLIIFISTRYWHYSRQRKESDHDDYLVIAKSENKDIPPGKYQKCPDMAMFGFKYSVILSIVLINLILTAHTFLVSLK